MGLRAEFRLTALALIASLCGLLFFGAPEVFIIVYIAVFCFMLAKTYLTNSKKSVKFWMTLVYALMLVCQIVLAYGVLFGEGSAGVATTLSAPSYFLQRAFCAFLVLVPLALSRYTTVDKYAQFYLPSIREAGVIAFSEWKAAAGAFAALGGGVKNAGNGLHPKNIIEFIADMPRHDSLKYINKDTLTPEYFRKAEETLKDPHLYIVISRTGSAASEMLRVVTHKDYNHASLSFDAELETVISYNGGERVYPPGLNPESLEQFRKKGTASLLVYSLSCTPTQKEQVLRRVREINRDGSAYNILGLITKHSYRPNIMFCSQFVYSMLDFAGLAYFETRSGFAEPMDFIEKDFHRALAFEYEV